MSLSCSCDNDYGDDFDWYFEPPDDFTALQTKRRRRCCSCKNPIDIGSTVLAFRRYRIAQWDTAEGRICGEGEEVPMATWCHCEHCGDLFLSLVDLGFCMQIDDNMNHNLKEYHEMFKKEDS